MFRSLATRTKACLATRTKACVAAVFALGAAAFTGSASATGFTPATFDELVWPVELSSIVTTIAGAVGLAMVAYLSVMVARRLLKAVSSRISKV